MLTLLDTKMYHYYILLVEPLDWIFLPETYAAVFDTVVQYELYLQFFLIYGVRPLPEEWRVVYAFACPGLPHDHIHVIVNIIH